MALTGGAVPEPHVSRVDVRDARQMHRAVRPARSGLEMRIGRAGNRLEGRLAGDGIGARDPVHRVGQDSHIHPHVVGHAAELVDVLLRKHAAAVAGPGPELAFRGADRIGDSEPLADLGLAVARGRLTILPVAMTSAAVSSRVVRHADDLRPPPRAMGHSAVDRRSRAARMVSGARPAVPGDRDRRPVGHAGPRRGHDRCLSGGASRLTGVARCARAGRALPGRAPSRGGRAARGPRPAPVVRSRPIGSVSSPRFPRWRPAPGHRPPTPSRPPLRSAGATGAPPRYLRWRSRLRSGTSARSPRRARRLRRCPT